MMNEYLFLSNEHRTTLETYKPSNIVVEIYGIDKTPLWVFTCYHARSNEKSAEKLSEVHLSVMRYSPLVLTCESSEYYNKNLFPLINELERKLRKLLYLAASISSNEKAKDSIKQLEEKDFGEIFDLLFIDTNFISDLKKRINADSKSEFNGKSRYSKAEVQIYLNSLVENTLWDLILDNKHVPTLKSRFRDVQTYRNNVMHAHNIDKKIFSKARYLLKKINGELNNAINIIVKFNEEKNTEKQLDVNTAISSAMISMNLSDISADIKNTNTTPFFPEISSQLLQISQNLHPSRMPSGITDAIKTIQLFASQPVFSEAIEKINLVANNPAVNKTVKNITFFQQQMNNLMKPYNQIEKMMRPYKAFQDSLQLVTDYLPYTAGLSGDNGEGDSEFDDKKEEENDPA